MGAKRLLAATLLLGAVAACNALLGIQTLDGGDVTENVDAGPDAANDAAALDANREGGDGATGFCAAQASAPLFFCADFDHGPIGLGWSSQDYNPSISSIALDDASFVSPPGSARFDRAAAVPDCSYVVLRWDSSSQLVSTLHYEAKVFLDIDDAGAFPATILAFGRDAPSGETCSLLIHADPLSVYLTEQNFFADGGRAQDIGHSSAIGVPGGRWTLIAIDADYSAGKVSVSVDGAIAIDSAPLSADCLGKAYGSASIGIHCEGATPKPEALRYDDFLFTGR